MKGRLYYPDICKFFAIFLVTWSHCAQIISGETWANFLGGNQIDIAFNMPLFMVMSGWFINLEKNRKMSFRDFFISKFRRLLIPSIVWFILPRFFTVHTIWTSVFSFYWYLNALFACLCLIFLIAKICRNNTLCCLISIVFVLLMPYTDFCHINFMLPFLWGRLSENYSHIG